MWIKDRTNGRVFKYGESRHDALVISEDGRYLTYENLQNGDGSLFGAYVFTDENGNIPNDIESIEYGRDYANIGGFKDTRKKGAWLTGRYGEFGECSVCGHRGCTSDIWNHCDEVRFCPNCGADLRSQECNR